MATSYPFPDNVHVTSSVTLKLTDSNYLLWKTQFESLLSSQKLIGFVNGAVNAPSQSRLVVNGEVTSEEPNPLYESWFCTDQLVRSWLFGTLSEEVLGHVHNLSTSRQIWVSLAENFNKSSVAREFSLRQNLQLLSKKEKPFSVYCREFKTICDALSSIGKPVDESMKIFGFLNGLGRDYDPITTVIQSSLSKLPTPTFNDVVSEVQGFDSKLQSYEEAASVTPHLAFNIERSESGSPQYNPNQKGRGRSGQNKGRGGYSTRGRGFSQHQSSPQVSGPRPVCQICGRTGHTALKCYNRFDNNYQAEIQAFSTLRVSDDTGKEWHPDSAATAHVTSSTNGLQSATEYEGDDAVLVGDGTYLPITHTGSTTIKSSNGKIPLNEVLVVPNIQKSLLSVSKLCDDYPCGVYFDANKVCIIDLQTQKVVTTGPRRNGLYVLENQEFVALYSNRQCAATEEVWHHRLGHANSKALQHLQNSKAIQINKSRTSPVCEPCQMGKSSRLPFLISDSRVLHPLDRIHCDLWGPSPVVSNQGLKYYAIFVDDYSRYSWFYPLHNKSEFLSVFISFQKLVENQLNTKIKVFQSDGGGEFVSNKLKTHLSEHGIHHRISCPYTPQQNGLAERKHRHLVELGLSMLFHSHTPQKFWVESFFTANYIINRLPSSVLKNLSPYEALFGEKPDYSSLRVFGSACYPCLRPLAQNKFDPRSLQCVFLGYNSQYKGYRCFYPPTGKVYISRNVIFNESELPFKEKYQSLVPQYSTPLLQAWQHNKISEISVPAAPVQLFSKPIDLNTYAGSQVTEQLTDPEPTSNNEGSDEEVNPVAEEIAANQEQVINSHAMTTRSKAGIQKPNTRYALITSRMNTAEPKTLASAMKHPGWNEAVHEEINRVHMLHTWSLVPPTDDMNILSSKWVFKTKLHPDGSIDKLKARLVAKGFDQEEGVDYLETFSPVVRTATIRLVLDVSTSKGWPIKQLDVSNAFLHGELQEPVFMYQPSGFIDPQKPTHVCRLTKAIYGLKQAPRAWFDTFSNFLLDYGFVCSKSDPSLFVCHQDGKILYLLLYVDDILLTGSDQSLLEDLLQALKNRFSMKDLGPPRYFLGIQIEDYANGLFLHQTAYATDILQQAGMSDCNPMPTPLPQQLDNLNSELFAEPTYFRSLAGKLQYLTITRPDIQFAVNFICQRMHSPTTSDFGLLKRILRYIKGTIGMGLPIKRNSTLTLSAYSDSDHAGCKNTRRSTTGFCILLGSNLISWSAKRQPTVSNSSTEAEYRALTYAAREITWISFLLRDLGIPQYLPTQVYCDNLSAVYLSANPALHNRSKHFDTDYHYIREQVALGLIETQHISATFQLADVFTKSLPRRAFVDLRSKLGVSGSPTPSLRGSVSNKQVTGPTTTKGPSQPSQIEEDKIDSSSKQSNDRTEEGRFA
ncbi:Strong similarity to gi/3600044 T12H20.12 protease homolog from Arabidopsis thaliana BAC gb/AF080119 and is a member of the reverse transcriptase family PF/00078 [Arabidopsis thaliana]|uniref:F28K20.17 protein n=1 Tax=Arabidopsis thaliana TaxID=3702 RepID=Q9SA17_ARATH|nr:Strong similarity to gi/3600044 T12H20.12 protease homolog from Arabidopsis thaliana BAC gb/AF080119 and is a member of the reverse transcriptase family PF/00078 [Arabidopsis thaliana]